ncbi:unnamed protein product, partial [Rotaria sp. Silwood1]
MDYLRSLAGCTGGQLVTDTGIRDRFANRTHDA